MSLLYAVKTEKTVPKTEVLPSVCEEEKRESENHYNKKGLWDIF